MLMPYSPIPVPETLRDLSSAPRGELVKVVDITGSRRVARRLTEMGFVPGAVVAVLSGGGRGPVIVGLDSCRLALGRKTAANIVVEAL